MPPPPEIEHLDIQFKGHIEIVSDAKKAVKKLNELIDAFNLLDRRVSLIDDTLGDDS